MFVNTLTQFMLFLSRILSYPCALNPRVMIMMKRRMTYGIYRSSLILPFHGKVLPLFVAHFSFEKIITLYDKSALKNIHACLK